MSITNNLTPLQTVLLLMSSEVMSLADVAEQAEDPEAQLEALFERIDSWEDSIEAENRTLKTILQELFDLSGRALEARDEARKELGLI